MKNLIIILFVSFNIIFAQSEDSILTANKVEHITKIYRNLEFNTTAFNDLKQTWVITDPVFIRELFNRFVTKNILTIDGRKPSLPEIQEKAKAIYDGKVFVELRRRYYDNEIELFRFFVEKEQGVDSTEYFFDEITDFVYIRDILGEKVYENIKSRIYAFNDLTKQTFDSKPAYNFDIRLSATDPELMFWSSTTSNRNKYLVSVFGTWGNDYIMFPGWYMPSYAAGLKVTYIDSLINNYPNMSFKFNAGMTIPTKRQPFLEFDDQSFGRRLYPAGTGLYFSFVGDPLRFAWSKLKDYELNIYGSFSLAKYDASDFGSDYFTQFYSTRNYLVFFVNKKNIVRFMDFGMLNAGLGLASYDIYHFLLDPNTNSLIDLQPKASSKYKNSVLGEASLQHDGGLLQYDVKFQINYNLNETAGYVGLKTNIMLSNSFGFDFKFFTNYKFGTKPLPFYRNSIYLVFSPVLRINY